ncbi:S24 family peptidase [Massilia sp. YIM B04103]|uniref:S24 family peptidase n=1 Tax=Massilia sp. YIM B04103 TaxID=2963106 RepID=UPI002108A3FE|nr:S24 family peptidase [Massilia sp. YIM B04103]
METNQCSTPLSRQQAQQLDLHLIPGLRNRLVAEMALRDIAQHQYVHFLSELTGRAPQTVARWIDPDHPGMPDLSSLALLSIQFGVDAGWLIGLSCTRLPLATSLLPVALRSQLAPAKPAQANWLAPLLAQAQACAAYQVALMQGDDMAPLIQHGAPFFFDDSIQQVDTNGVYLLQYRGKTLVRHIEIRIGEGLLLRCENARYRTTLVRDHGHAHAMGLTILGRVKLAINACAM